MEIKTKYNIGDKLYIICFSPEPNISIDEIETVDVNIYNTKKKEIIYGAKSDRQVYEKEINKVSRFSKHGTYYADNKERALENLKIYLEQQYKDIEKRLSEEEEE